MISVVYNIGGHCTREDAKKVMTIAVTHPKVDNPKKSSDYVVINAIAVFIANEDFVYIFYRNGDSQEDCNDVIAMGTYELDLRLYSLFGVHTKKEFEAMRDTGKRNAVEFRELDGKEVPVPVAETKAKKKASKEKK